MTHRKVLLEKAIEVTCNSRQAEYGTPLDNLSNTAHLYNAYLLSKCPEWRGTMLDAEDVAWLNTLQKISRTISGQAGDDTYLDAAAYAAIAGEVRSRYTKTEPIRTMGVQPCIQFIADNRTKVFAYPFFIFQGNDLEVSLDDVLQTTSYTVSGVDNSTGGNVTFAVAPNKNVKVTLRRCKVRS